MRQIVAKSMSHVYMLCPCTTAVNYSFCCSPESRNLGIIQNHKPGSNPGLGWFPSGSDAEDLFLVLFLHILDLVGFHLDLQIFLVSYLPSTLRHHYSVQPMSVRVDRKRLEDKIFSRLDRNCGNRSRLC